MIEQGLMWVIIYCIGVVIHMVIASLTMDKDFRGSSDEIMLWLMCLIPMTWIFYWLSGSFYLTEKIKDGRHKRKN